MAAKQQSLELQSGGFDLFVPPTRFAQIGEGQVGEEAMLFQGLDDINDVFYQITYPNKNPPNASTWADLSLHNKNDICIMFPPSQMDTFEAGVSSLVTGFLVDILERSEARLSGRLIGTVRVNRTAQHGMNWSGLEGMKQEELPTEMRAGLLRQVFNRRSDRDQTPHIYVTAQDVLENMPRPWHRDGASLNWELDGKFVGLKAIERSQNWRLIP